MSRRVVATGCLLGLLLGSADAVAQTPHQCFVLEFFYDSGVDDAGPMREAMAAFAAGRNGLQVTYRDLHDDDRARARVDEIAKYFRLPAIALPAVYGLKTIVSGLKTEQQLRSQLGRMLTVTAYVRNGCPHCQDAKSFLAKYQSRYPALQIVYREVVTDASARSEMEAVARRYSQAAASLPVIHYCNGVSVGFDREATTGSRILQTLDYWSKACTAEKKTAAATVPGN